MQLYNRPPMPLRTPDTLPVLLSLTAGAGGYVATWAGYGSTELAAVAGGVTCTLAALWFGTWHYRVAAEQEQTERLAVIAEHEHAAPAPVNTNLVQMPTGATWDKARNTLILPATKRAKKRNPWRKHNLEIVGRVGVETDASGLHVEYYDVAELLWRWARYGGADTQETGERKWTPRSGGKPFDAKEYLALRKWLMRENMARWLNPNSHQVGWGITGRTRAIMRGLAQSTTPPLPKIIQYHADDDAA